MSQSDTTEIFSRAARNNRGRRPASWLNYGLVALLMAGGALILRQIEFPEMTVQAPAEAFIRIAPAAKDRSRADQQALALFDTEPLFLPTRWNAAARLEALPELAPTVQLFDQFLPQVDFSSAQRPLQLRQPFTGAPARAMTLSATPPGSTWRAWGQTPGDSLSLAGTSGGYTVTEIESGAVVRRGALPVTVVERAAGGPWQPVRFLIHLDESGLLGPPLRRTSSGTETIDAALLAVVSQYTFLRDLGPGYYRVEFTP